MSRPSSSAARSPSTAKIPRSPPTAAPPATPTSARPRFSSWRPPRATRLPTARAAWMPPSRSPACSTPAPIASPSAAAAPSPPATSRDGIYCQRRPHRLGRSRGPGLRRQDRADQRQGHSQRQRSRAHHRLQHHPQPLRAQGPGSVHRDHQGLLVYLRRALHGRRLRGRRHALPGTYRVSVSRGSSVATSNLPSTAFIANGSLVVSADLTGQVFDVKTVQIGGKVTLNGKDPELTADCSTTRNPYERKAQVQFLETSKGYSFTYGARCMDAAFEVAGMLYPGTYRVSVSRGSSVATSNLPRRHSSPTAPSSSPPTSLARSSTSRPSRSADA